MSDRLPTGQIIALHREALGLTQAAFAVKAGISRAEINMIEKGRIKPRLDTLRKIAKALSLDVKDLL